uniref:ZSWIM1/3 RNaseH-like domain-containing protein n=1 Tax=Schistosoma haematobium TaxID=6185 RepID=A0A095AFL5_SCHHA
MVKTGNSTESIVKYAEKNFEKTITVHYVNNLKYKFVERKLIPYIYGFLGCGSLNDVIATLRNNGKLFISYGGLANQVTKIAVSTHEQIVTYKRFPEFVCLDSTYNTNRGKKVKFSCELTVFSYKLFQLVCTDNCGHGVPVMFAWTKEEKKVDVVWILDHFKKIMNGTSQTETFVMDCARSIISAVELMQCTAHIALCSFHV